MVLHDVRVRNFFAANARDVTPLGAGQEINVLYAPFAAQVKLTEYCLSTLSPDERHQVQRLANDALRSRFVQRRAFARYCTTVALNAAKPLSQMPIGNDGKGRPFVPDRPALSLSFSSCRFGMLGAWSANHSIGVDIEDATRPIDAVAMAEAFYSEAENSVIEAACPGERETFFYRLWSLKEAALKSIGQGLPYGMDRFVFELTEAARCLEAPAEFGDPSGFTAYEINIKDASAALISLEKISSPDQFDAIAGVQGR